MQSMKGATMLLGSMNRQMNLPALQRIAMEFERENDVMDQRQEMMDDAVDEATGLEGEEEEGEDIVKEVLDEIGVDLNQSVGLLLMPSFRPGAAQLTVNSWARLLLIYRRAPSGRPKSHNHRRLARVQAQAQAQARVQAAETRATTICKQGWIACADDATISDIFCVLRIQGMELLWRFSR